MPDATKPMPDSWPHVEDLAEWNEETKWDWGEPRATLIPGWGYAVVHPFSTRPDWPGMPDSEKKESYGLVVAVYTDLTHLERVSLFILDGGHVSDHANPWGWTFDYWQAHSQ